jgi:hypothetical protein
MTDITFKPIGVHSLDSFFARAKEILDSFTEITSPLKE